MKKYLFIPFIAFIGGIFNSNAMEEYSRSKKIVENLQGAALRRAAIQGALFGGAVGAIGGFSAARRWITARPALEQTWPQIAGGLVGGAGGAGLGAGIGAATAIAISTFMLWKINQVLHEYTPFTFNNLPADQAVMVLAAYRKNIKLMQYVMPQVQDFLNEQGVWEALAHLYFGLPPTPELITQLQKQCSV